MVSINKNFTTSQTGATFFNSSTEEDGRLVSAPPQAHHFTPLRTIKYAGSHAVASLLISVVGIVLAVREPDLQHRCRAYFIMLYLHAAFWFFTLVIDYILKKTHHSLRVSGYLEFYQKTYTLHRAPIYIVSLWNAFLLLVQSISQHLYPDDFSQQCTHSGITSPASYITTFIWLETLLLSFIHAHYINKVFNFNKSQQRPDVQRDLVVVDGGAGGGAGGSAAGTQPHAARDVVAPLNQTLSQTADLLARQADLIRHLREHNEKLSNKLSTTQAQLRAAQHNAERDKTSPA